MSTSAPLSGVELIVHIGAGKTGTSSVQRTLASQSDALQRQGAFYLGLMCENAPKPEQTFPWMTPGGWVEFKSKEPSIAANQIKTVLVEALGRLKAAGYSSAIWSNESLFSDGAFMVPVLHEIHALGAKVKVIVYIRRHDNWARSAYLQWGVKHKTYDGPVKTFREWNDTHSITFAGGLGPWLNHGWFEFLVRNFDTCQNVVTDFLTAAGLDVTTIDSKRDNETPNSVALALWALYNSQSKEPILPKELQPLLQRSGLLGQKPIGCDFNSLLPTEEDIARVVALASDDRAFINRLFAQNNQPEMLTSEPKKKDLAVSQEQINAALLMIIKHQGDRISWLTRQIKEIKEEISKK